LDTLELDRAVKVARDFAQRRSDTLVIVTADHETSGVSLIGASRLTDVKLQEQIAKGGRENVRDPVVGLYERAGFPKYRLAADGYPETTDVDYRLLVGYGGNADPTKIGAPTPSRCVRGAAIPRPTRPSSRPTRRVPPTATMRPAIS